VPLNTSHLELAKLATKDEGYWRVVRRVQLRQQIMEWYEDHNRPCIFWLNGMARTGKSTISRTVACELAEKKRLAASFFFPEAGELLATPENSLLP